MNLIDWCDRNFLNCELNEEDGIACIGGQYFFVLNFEDESKITDSDLNLKLPSQVFKLSFEHKINGVVFELGSNWFFVKITDVDKFMKTKELNLTGLQILKYIGEIKDKAFIQQWSMLGVHSEYELMNGSGNAEDWCEKAKFLGLKSLGICDKNTLAGTLGFQSACLKNNIKPVIGLTLEVENTLGIYSVILFAKTSKGWQNLLRINKAINIDSDTKIIPQSTLFEYCADLFLVFHRNSFVNDCTLIDEEVFKNILEYRNHFECFYQLDSVEFVSEQVDVKYLDGLKRYFNFYKNDLHPVLLNDAYYIDQEDHLVKNYLNKIDRVAQPESKNQHFKSLDESYVDLAPIFSNEDQFIDFFIESINNTNFIAENCNFTINTGESKLPKYEAVSISECGYDRDIFHQKNQVFWSALELEQNDNLGLFFYLIEQGWDTKVSKFGVKKQAAYKQRLETELAVVVPADLHDYFLILWDVVYWCKTESNIKVGTGRGSVGGSLIAYLLDIITIDPIEHDLMFERFMNETRVLPEKKIEVLFTSGLKKLISPQEFELLKQNDIKSFKERLIKRPDSLPDIDLDFEADRRDEVKQYFVKKYGQHSVCSVGAYDRMKVKSSIKNFCRVEGFGFDYVNMVTKEMDDQLKWEWSDLFKYALTSKVVYEFVQKNHKIVELMRLTMNQASTSTIHASAILVLPKLDPDGNPMEVYDWLPVKKMKNKDGEFVLVSEWEGKYTDLGGFLKEDILGLNQLDKFKNIERLILENHGENIVLEQISLDDENVYKCFGKGWVEDVFQFGSDGLRAFCRQAKPFEFDHLSAMNALYRPGPMSSNAHNDFAEILNGKKQPQYDFGLREITEKTAGLYVFQEQIMQAVVTLGGFSLVESDTVRTMMKKFDKVKMAAMKDKFIEGAVKNNCSFDEAGVIWDKLVAFSGYGFNRCLTGDTIIFRFTGNQFYPKELTLEQFFNLKNFSNVKKKYRRQGHLGLVRHFNPDTNKIQYAKVKDIHYNGLKQVFELKLKNGFTLKATDNHKILTKVGYKQIKELSFKDIIFCCGDKIQDWEKTYKPTGEGNNWAKFIGEAKDGRTNKLKIAKKIAFKRSNGVCEKCKKTPDKRPEFHHVDGKPLNNHPNNIMFVCNSCHKILDYELGLKHGNRDLGYYKIESKVESIRCVGVEPTYDLEMFEEPHNFIANGIVSHNSHSSAYAMMSYWSMYLKLYYPVEFWTTSFQFSRDSDIPYRIFEMNKIHPEIKLSPPNVNFSGNYFVGSNKKKTIYWSLSKIKGIGDKIVEKIVNERKNKEFADLQDFQKRMKGTGVGKNILQSLVLSGGFDECYGLKNPKQRRGLMKEFLGLIGEAHSAEFDNESETFWISKQRELTGYGDIDFKKLIYAVDNRLANIFMTPTQVQEARKRESACVAGEVDIMYVRNSKRGDFANIRLRSNNGFVDLTIWSDTYEKYKDLLEQSKANKVSICVSGQVDFDNYKKVNTVYSTDKSKVFFI